MSYCAFKQCRGCQLSRDMLFFIDTAALRTHPIVLYGEYGLYPEHKITAHFNREDLYFNKFSMLPKTIITQRVPGFNLQFYHFVSNWKKIIKTPVTLLPLQGKYFNVIHNSSLHKNGFWLMLLHFCFLECQHGAPFELV